MATVAIHQPGYLPWLGYFHKMMHCDTFVFLDDVQYERRGWQNRNKIKSNTGSLWLSVPITAGIDDPINRVKIFNGDKWAIRHKKSIIANYAKSAFFEEYWQHLEPAYEAEYDLLLDVDMELIGRFMKLLGIGTKTLLSSELGVTSKSSDRILDICKALGADTYVSGALGTNYLDLGDFGDAGIAVRFQHVSHPVYRQRFGPFMPNMSALDLLLNEGPDSARIIRETEIAWK